MKTLGVTQYKDEKMAIKLSDYKTIPKSANVKIHKTDNRKFLFRFKMKVWDTNSGTYKPKQFSKVYTVKATNHSRKENIQEAQIAFITFKQDTQNKESVSAINKISLDELFCKYMETEPLTDWTHKKKHIYDLYIGNSGLSNITKEPTKELLVKRAKYDEVKIGGMEVSTIMPMHIEKITSQMEKVHNLSPRTQKGIIEILSPLFNFAIRNKYMTESPTQDITIKIPSQKKIVTNATELFKRVYVGITEYYKDEPFYQALFLFGFTGRRKSEILNLKWENVDLNGDYYWIEDTKNGEKQRYPLPLMIKDPLMRILDDRVGLVFKSPITTKPLTGIDRPMRNLKKHIGIDNLTLHYMRNILVSTLAEQGTEAVTLSGILGHKDINTINKYLSNSTMESGLKGLKTIDGILDVEVVVNGNL